VCVVFSSGNPKFQANWGVIDVAGNQYLTGLTLYFIGYVLFEIPCNVSNSMTRFYFAICILKPALKVILKKTTPRIWLPTLTLVWGIVATLLGVVQNYSGYLSSRFFLGVAESGLFPGVVFYLSMWYKRNEQHYRVALFFSAASLAGAFGGVLAWVSFHLMSIRGPQLTVSRVSRT
jgi:MFS family permease